MDVYTEYHEGMSGEWAKENMQASLENYSMELLESSYTLNTGFTFTTVQVTGMKDKVLEKKINDSLGSYFFIMEEPNGEKHDWNEWHKKVCVFLRLSFAFNCNATANIPN